MAVKVIEEAKDGLANTGKNFTDDITKKFESTNSAKKPSIQTDDVLQQKPDKIPEQKPKEVPTQKPNETPEQNTKKLSETDDIITVEKGNSGVNGHDNVEFSGEKPKSNIDDIRTKAIENNSVGKDKAPTNEQMPEVKIREITHKRLSEKVKGIRNKFKELCKEGKVPKGIVVRGNIAIAEVDISGMPKEFMAHSSINTKNAKAAQYGTFSYLPETRNLKSYVDAPTGIKGLTIEEALKKEAVPRYNDAEAKILEDITSRIKDTPDIKGKINLYTEKACCQSCSNLILEFKRKFPNIELNIYTDNL